MTKEEVEELEAEIAADAMSAVEAPPNREIPAEAIAGRNIAVKVLAKYENGDIDGRDIMAFGMSTEGLYRAYFGVGFPFENYEGKNVIRTMLRCIIDDKPYEPALITAEA